MAAVLQKLQCLLCRYEQAARLALKCLYVGQTVHGVRQAHKTVEAWAYYKPISGYPNYINSVHWRFGRRSPDDGECLGLGIAGDFPSLLAGV